MISFELTDCYVDWTEVRAPDGVFFDLAVADLEAEVFASVLDVAAWYRSVRAGRAVDDHLGTGGRLELAPTGDDVVVKLQTSDAVHRERVGREQASRRLRNLLEEVFDEMEAGSSPPPVEERNDDVESLMALQSSLHD